VKRFYAILGYGWAALTVVIVLATFMGNDYFSRNLAGAAGVTVSPWFTGGEIAKTIDHDTYRAFVHRPVFDGLVSERSEGFVQVDWKPAQSLPPVITESLTLPAGEEVSIRLDTRTGSAALVPAGRTEARLDQTYKLKDGWAVRVALRKAPQP